MAWWRAGAAAVVGLALLVLVVWWGMDGTAALRMGAMGALLVSAYSSQARAQRKGQSPALWLLLGLFPPTQLFLGSLPGRPAGDRLDRHERWATFLSAILVLGAATWTILTFADYTHRTSPITYDFDWGLFFSTRYDATTGTTLHYGRMLLSGLRVTIAISCISAAVALVLGTLVGVARLVPIPPLRLLATAYVEFFRNTPLLVQLFFWYFGLTTVTPLWVNKFLYQYPFEIIAATVGLAIYTSSYIAEVVRAGIQAVPRGHLEAALATGLTGPQALRWVVLPQAFRTVIPPLGSQLLNNLKNSSLVMTIAVADLTWNSQQIQAYSFKGFEPTTAATVLYLAMSLTIAGMVHLVERWSAVPGVRS